jgi:succinate-semialdehyde dehydrogenase/glutarate-semialdehyde dehydrogenase
MRTKMYIDGQWVDGIKTMPVTDPSDGSVIAEVAVAGPEQCEAAVAAADRAAADWAKTAPRVRSEILRKAFEIMVSEADAIATIVAKY